MSGRRRALSLGAFSVAAALATVATVGTGCGISVTNDFQGIPFVPATRILAVADRQELIVRNGAVVPVLKAPADQTIDVLLTAARVDVNENWRELPEDAGLELRRELSTSDGLLLKDIPLERFRTSKLPLVATLDNGIVTGDFDFAVGTSLPPPDTVKTQGLGSKIQVTIHPGSVDAQPRSGNINAEVEVERDREAGQDGDVATGTVNISFSERLVRERLGEQNLTIAVPVLQCMQALGPARGAACLNVDPLPYADETGIVEP